MGIVFAARAISPVWRRQVWIFEPGAIFLLGVFPTQLIRHKVKMLTNPTRNSRFPFKKPLRETPTTYLAHKATRTTRANPAAASFRRQYRHYHHC